MKKCESKLNPLAEEFVPWMRRRLSATVPEFLPSGHFRRPIVFDVAQAQRSCAQSGSSHTEVRALVELERTKMRRKNSKIKRTIYVRDIDPLGSENSSRIRKDKNAEKESKIKRTVHVRDIDPRITEEELMREFSNCGVVKGSCICGDTQSGLRYGFVEFENEDCTKVAMRLNCTRIGLYPVRVLPSHRTIAPHNSLPSHSVDDQEKIIRTVYCSYIDKTLSEKDLKEFFEIKCGEVSCISLLGDHKISNSRHGFIEFVKEEFAVAAIKCTGMVLGNYRVKVVASKAPIRHCQQ